MKLVLGTVQFGIQYGVNNQVGKLDESGVHALLDRARQLDIQELDTADGYGNASEVLASYFLQGKDHQLSIMSKFLVQDEGVSFSRYLDLTLNRLGLDKIDGYYFHRFADFVKFKDFSGVREAKQQGKLSYLGVSLYELSDLEFAATHPDVDVIQLPLNILDAAPEKMVLLRKAREHGKKIYVRSVYLQGLFFMDPAKMPAKLLPLKAVVEQIQDLAKKSGFLVEELALGYAKSLEEIDKIVFGVDQIQQLESTVKAYKKQIPLEVIQELKKIEVEPQFRFLLNPVNWN